MRIVASILAGLFVSSTVAVTATHAQVLGGELKGTDTAVYLRNAVALYDDAALIAAPDLSDVTALRLRYDNELYAEFHPVPVKVGQSYTLSFKGRWDNRETIETNPTFATALRETWETGLEVLPTLAVEFLNDRKEPLKTRVFAVMPYGQWRDYRYSFAPPLGAMSVLVKVKSGRNRGSFYIAAPKLEAQPASAETLAMNFRRDDANIVGKAFGFLLDGTARVAGDGAILTNSGNGNRSDPFPLTAPGTYRLSLKGVATNGKSKNIVLTFFDADAKRTGDVASTDLALKPVEFALPDKTVAGQLTIQNHLLDEIRIERVR